MEKIQERALRFIHNDFQSSSEVLLSLTDTIPLHIKRMKFMACEVFKIVSDLSPKYLQDLINIKVSNYNFRNEQQATLPQVKSTSYGSHFGMRPSGYGIASQTTSEELNPIDSLRRYLR